MTRFAESVPGLQLKEPSGTGTLVLPVVEVTHFEWATFQWSLADPPGGSAVGTITAWDFFITALPEDQMVDRVTGLFFTPAARPDLWMPAPFIAFPSLPAGVLGTSITQPWRCAAHTFVAATIDVSVALDRFSYFRCAFGP